MNVFSSFYLLTQFQGNLYGYIIKINANKPCNGISIMHISIPKNADAPISRHNIHVIQIICNGPIHKKFKYFIAESNLFTSFDNKFTI